MCYCPLKAIIIGTGLLEKKPDLTWSNICSHFSYYPWIIVFSPFILWSYPAKIAELYVPAHNSEWLFSVDIFTNASLSQCPRHDGSERGQSSCPNRNHIPQNARSVLLWWEECVPAAREKGAAVSSVAQTALHHARSHATASLRGTGKLYN